MSVSLWCEEEEVQDRTHGRESSVRAPWDPSASGLRVIQRLLQSEGRYLPSPLYTSLIQREPHRREELAKWTMEVCCECDCDESVFPLAVSLLDRYLSATLSLPVSPTCLAAACILVASKLTECDTVSADTLCAAAEYDFMSSNLREMERVVLATLRWDVAAVTPQDFIPHFLLTLGELKDGDTHTGDFLTTLRRHSDTLVAMCVCDSRFLGTPPSLVAAAALNSALRGLRIKTALELSVMTSALATLCQTDVAVLQCCTELIEGALRERLRNGPQEGKDGDIEDERASTPTDLREIDF
ncbi:cyclin Dx [Misgurnus anguillicaudatus]|uniref:cyclin Dx n=1 Tax=Misgurnus anguillicaudatus TaxID=75329 RepID=UPI002435BE05|nr:cyclin Dx [Misgurnus anguillicaudatus]